MKTTSWYSMSEGVFKVRLDAENAKETELLVRMGNGAAKSVRTFGRIGEIGAWVWFEIPIVAKKARAEIGNK